MGDIGRVGWAKSIVELEHAWNDQKESASSFASLHASSLASPGFNFAPVSSLFLFVFCGSSCNPFSCLAVMHEAEFRSVQHSNAGCCMPCSRGGDRFEEGEQVLSDGLWMDCQCCAPAALLNCMVWLILPNTDNNNYFSFLFLGGILHPPPADANGPIAKTFLLPVLAPWRAI